MKTVLSCHQSLTPEEQTVNNNQIDKQQKEASSFLGDLMSES